MKKKLVTGKIRGTFHFDRFELNPRSVPMKIFHIGKQLFFGYLILSSLFLISCGKKSSSGKLAEPSAQNSTLEATSARYDVLEEAFFAEVTVTVRDKDEKVLPNVTVSLASNNENAAVSPGEVITDGEGKAVFEVSSHHRGTVEFTAMAGRMEPLDPEKAVTIDEQATVEFDAFVTIELVADPVYAYDRGTYSLQLTLSDPSGIVEGADLSYMPAFNGVTVTPEDMVTDEAGQAEFTAVSMWDGEVEMLFSLAGIVEALQAEILLPGPRISGDVTVGMSSPEILHPRVGVFALQVFGGQPAILGELPGSVAVDMTAETPRFELNLPIAPPTEWLTPINEDMLLGYFPPAMYNDANQNGVWDEDEFIIGFHGTPGALIYARPSGTETLPILGWNFLQALEENPQLMPWATAADAQDITVLSAPVRVPDVQGEAITAMANIRVAFMLVDAPAFMEALNGGGNPWLLLYDSAHSAALLDVPLEGPGFGGQAADPQAILDSATLQAWSMVQELGPGMFIRQLLILPVLYQDTDENGSLSDGEPLTGTLKPPFGVEWNFSYMMDLPRLFGFFAEDRLFMHAGWNWWAHPTEYRITQVIVNMPGFPTLEVHKDVRPGLTDIAFEVYASDAGNDDPPKAWGQFASGGAPNLLSITACTHCNLIAVGDTLRVVEEISETMFLDWSEIVHMGPFGL